MSGLTRREFLAATGGTAAALFWGEGVLAQESGSAVEPLRGFVISDAHFGWNDPQQPSVEAQREAMAQIVKRFPDLDVLIDSGDAHHNYATAADRGNWTDVVVRGSGPRPFYYLAGNHDVTAWSYPWDPEQDAARLGSNGCRTYFSFDLKGIHFLAIPELMNVCSVTEEVLEWARLDLALNKGKTVVVISHNALSGTTEPRSDNAYRVIVNSGQVEELLGLATGPCVWMHGHNHDYNLVKKDGRLYVSNGRFGGFAPRDSTSAASNAFKAPRGGMYFEIHPDRIVVRSYSVEHGKFLDELPGGESLSHTLKGATSFDAAAKPRHSYGVGRMAPGTKMPVYGYHTANAATLYLQPAKPALNQNPDFSQYTVRRSGGKVDRMLIGYQCNPDYDKASGKDAGYVWNNPGITIAPMAGREAVVLGAPGNGRGRRGYYRIAAGSTVKLKVELGALTEGAEVTPVLRLATNDTNDHGEVRQEAIALKAGTKTIEATFEVPEKAGIYGDAESDLLLSGWIDLEFRKLAGPVELKSFEVTAEGGKIAKVAVAVDGEIYQGEGADIVEVPLKPWNRERVVVEAISQQPVTWLVREEPTWQVRNAPVTTTETGWSITRRTNDFSPAKDVLFAPCGKNETPYVHRVSGICPVRVEAFDAKAGELRLDATEIDGEGIVEIVTTRKPKSATGAEIVDHADGRLRARVPQAGPVTFTF